MENLNIDSRKGYLTSSSFPVNKEESPELTRNKPICHKTKKTHASRDRYDPMGTNAEKSCRLPLYGAGLFPPLRQVNITSNNITETRPSTEEQPTSSPSVGQIQNKTAWAKLCADSAKIPPIYEALQLDLQQLNKPAVPVACNDRNSRTNCCLDARIKIPPVYETLQLDLQQLNKPAVPVACNDRNSRTNSGLNVKMKTMHRRLAVETGVDDSLQSYSSPESKHMSADDGENVERGPSKDTVRDTWEMNRFKNTFWVNKKMGCTRNTSRINPQMGWNVLPKVFSTSQKTSVFANNSSRKEVKVEDCVRITRVTKGQKSVSGSRTYVNVLSTKSILPRIRETSCSRTNLILDINQKYTTNKQKQMINSQTFSNGLLDTYANLPPTDAKTEREELKMHELDIEHKGKESPKLIAPNNSPRHVDSLFQTCSSSPIINITSQMVGKTGSLDDLDLLMPVHVCQSTSSVDLPRHVCQSTSIVDLPRHVCQSTSIVDLPRHVCQSTSIVDLPRHVCQSTSILDLPRHVCQYTSILDLLRHVCQSTCIPGIGSKIETKEDPKRNIERIDFLKQYMTRYMTVIPQTYLSSLIDVVYPSHSTSSMPCDVETRNDNTENISSANLPTYFDSFLVNPMTDHNLGLQCFNMEIGAGKDGQKEDKLKQLNYDRIPLTASSRGSGENIPLRMPNSEFSKDSDRSLSSSETVNGMRHHPTDNASTFHNKDMRHLSTDTSSSVNNEDVKHRSIDRSSSVKSKSMRHHSTDKSFKVEGESMRHHSTDRSSKVEGKSMRHHSTDMSFNVEAKSMRHHSTDRSSKVEGKRMRLHSTYRLPSIKKKRIRHHSTNISSNVNNRDIRHNSKGSSSNVKNKSKRPSSTDRSLTTTNKSILQHSTDSLSNDKNKGMRPNSTHTKGMRNNRTHKPSSKCLLSICKSFSIESKGMRHPSTDNSSNTDKKGIRHNSSDNSSNMSKKGMHQDSSDNSSNMDNKDNKAICHNPSHNSSNMDNKGMRHNSTDNPRRMHTEGTLHYSTGNPLSLMDNQGKRHNSTCNSSTKDKTNERHNSTDTPSSMRDDNNNKGMSHNSSYNSSYVHNKYMSHDSTYLSSYPDINGMRHHSTYNPAYLDSWGFRHNSTDYTPSLDVRGLRHNSTDDTPLLDTRGMRHNSTCIFCSFEYSSGQFGGVQIPEIVYTSPSQDPCEDVGLGTNLVKIYGQYIIRQREITSLVEDIKELNARTATLSLLIRQDDGPRVKRNKDVY